MTDDTREEEAVKPPAAQPKGRTPPYIAFKTFQTLLSELKTNGLPPQIDRTVLTRFSGGLQGQIHLALRSLDLMDAEKRPTPKLAELVEAYETPQFKPLLRSLIEETYPYVLKLDLMKATPGMFAESFKEGTDAKEEVLRKCRTFFLHAAKEVGIPLGTRIEKAKFPRSKSNGARKPKAAKQQEQQKPDERREENSPPQQPGGFADKLLDKYPPFDPAWPDPIKAQWFEGFAQFSKLMNAENSGG